MSTHRLGRVEDFPVETPIRTEIAGGSAVVIRRSDDTVTAFSDRCPHVGLSLTKGPGGTKYDDGIITCPFHNSAFDVTSGECLDWTPGFAGVRVPGWSRRIVAMGRKPSPLGLFGAHVVDGFVVVEL